jgi:hypothetical protein
VSTLSLSVVPKPGKPARYPCPEGCGYSMESKGSIPAHLDMAHGSLDRRDQVWLDSQVAQVETGAGAVTEILNNWDNRRKVGRLHPDVSAIAYIREHAPSLRLGRDDSPLLLRETNLSYSAIAEITGASVMTVARDAEAEGFTNVKPRVGLNNRPAKGGRPRTVTATVIDDAPPPPAKSVSPDPDPVMTGSREDTPIDSEAWSALLGVVDAIDALSSRDAAYVAATVPHRRRAATAKRLRKLGNYIGSIAWSLEREDYTP